MDVKFCFYNFAKVNQVTHTIMKKSLLITALLMIGTMSVSAEKTRIPISYNRTGSSGTNTSTNRAPLRHLPIEVVFDDESGLLEVTCSDAI